MCEYRLERQSDFEKRIVRVLFHFEEIMFYGKCVCVRVRVCVWVSKQLD